jgi:transposase
MDSITMSGKEAPRPGILKALCGGRITNQQAADALRLSVRQVQRLKGRYATDGARGLVHRGRGQPSPRRLLDPVRKQIVALMTTTYVGFNDAHLTEKLQEVHHLTVSRATVRRWRRALGIAPARRRRRPKARRRRPRREAVGSLVQVDGSPFAWLEDRGPAMTLLGAIDDASGQILALHFRPTEDLHGYLTLFRQLFTTHGLPVAIYGDRLNVFVRNDRHWTLEEELQGAQHPTHLGRVLHELGIGYIAAHSPQAKGRVERLWQTLQDRLVSELRLHGIRTLDAAHAFLPAFIADFNRRFAVAPAEPRPAWRRPPRDLDHLLGCRYSLVIGRDHTVRLGPRWLPLPAAPPGQAYPGRRIEVRELLDGRLLALADGALLATQPSPGEGFTLRPRRAPHADRRRRRSSASAPRLQERRSPPDPLSHPAPTTASSNASSTSRRSSRPGPDHPWNRSLALHLVRKAHRTRG